MSKKVDGRKNNAGKHLIKAEGQKKRPVTIYAVNDDIELVGGIECARDILKLAWQGYVLSLKKEKGLI